MGFCWYIFIIPIKWKHIVVGFYCEENDKIKTLNLFSSFVAFRIYEYKMLCRLDS